MAIKKRTLTATGAGLTLVVPSASSIPDRPENFIHDNSIRALTWKRDNNEDDVKIADYFQVYRSKTGYNGTYRFLKKVDNPTTGSVEYTDPLGEQGWWYKIRAVNARGDKSLFTQPEEIREDTEIVRIIGVLRNQDGTRLTNAQVSAKLSNGDAEINAIDGWQTLLSYREVSVSPDNISAFFELILFRLPGSGETKYTFKVVSGKFETEKELTLLTGNEQWLSVDSSGNLELENRGN